MIHPTSVYLLEKKVFHPLDEIRVDTQVRPYDYSLTLALSRGERGSVDCFPSRPDCKVAGQA